MPTRSTTLCFALLLALVASTSFAQEQRGRGRWLAPRAGNTYQAQPWAPRMQAGFSTQGMGTRSPAPGRSQLPAGRSYYQGRYFGNLNNRFYGPQYGYF